MNYFKIIIFFCIAFLSLETYGQLPQTNNLISYYPFLGNLEDQSTSNHDTGVANGNPSLTQNRFGTSNAAYYLDGTDDYLYFGNSIYVDLPDTDSDGYYEDDYTISIWAKSSVVDNEIFIAFGEADGLYTGMISVIGTNISFNSSNWGFPSTSTSGKKSDNNWHQYTFVYNAGSFRKLFIDGSLVKQANDALRKFNFKNYGLSVGVGRFNAAGNPEGIATTYTGSVDDVRIWNVALTNTEVSNLYTYENNAANDFSLPPPTPFVTTWQTDGSNNIIIPLTGSGYDFTVDWGDGTIETKTGSPGNISHTYASSGIKTVSITPNIATGFPRIYVNNFGNKNLLQTIESWGSGQWGAAVDRSFFGAANLEANATDIPDFSATTNFQYMFANCTSVTGTNGFANWTLNTNPTANVSFSAMFQFATQFNGDISNWDVSRGNTFGAMFNNAQKFNQNIGSWNVSNATFMAHMFRSTLLFDQDLSGWDVSSVTNMAFMFYDTRAFNSPLTWGIKTANVTNMASMFQSSRVFNQDISGWDVSSVTDMSSMFYFAQVFNQNISAWNVSNVTNMGSMLRSMPLFNQPLNWGTKTRKVTNMEQMLRDSPQFNQDINSWDVSKVTNTLHMFYNATSFNQNISGWDVSSVTNMTGMFFNATSFNRDISTWNISKLTNLNSFLVNVKLSRANYDALLLGWSTLDAGETLVPVNLNAHFGSNKYSDTPTVLTARNTTLIANKGWAITDGGMDADVILPEIASNALASDNTTINITFSENVYRTDVGSGVLETTDFLFAISGGTATLNTTTPSSISTSDNLTFVLGIDMSGAPDGTEMLTVTPVANSIFDVSGNIASATQSNNTAQLNDFSVPIITGPSSETGLNSAVSLNENIAAVFTFLADETVNWTLGTANDAGLFGIDSSGNLVFTTAPDYETPLSTLSSNTYVVEVIATDAASNTTTQTFSISVLDIANSTFVTFAAITKQYFSGTHTISVPTTNNTNPIVYTSDNAAVATVSGSVITFTGVGTANITATQAADASYEGNSVSSLLTVLGKDLVSKYGGISSTDVNYTSATGSVGGSLGIDKYGQKVEVADAIISSGLVIHLDASNTVSYPGTGTTWTDLSGNGNNGTLKNGVGYNSDNEGSLVFDGVNDYFVTNNNLDLSSTDKLTIQIILKTASSNVEMVLEHSTDWNSNNAFGVSAGQPTGKMEFTDHNQGYNVSHSTNTLNDNNWHVFTVTVDRSQVTSNQNLIYTDGVLNHTQHPSHNSDTSANYSDLPLYIGSRAGSNFFFNGNIAQVLIYKRALTATEVQQNFNVVRLKYGL